MFGTFRFIATLFAVTALFLDDALAFGPRAFLKRQASPSAEMAPPKAAMDQQVAMEPQQQQKHFERFEMEPQYMAQFVPSPATAYYGGGVGGVSYSGAAFAPQQLQQKRFDYVPTDPYSYESFYPFVPAKRFDAGGFGAAYGSRGRFSGFL
ncbi:hypothetical protein niasHS_009808 [Heterodera schachtii]|uniref:Uncharacterized protein n=2 Tax=Heterodera TaxID=34509 RepID=A0ABD2JAF1_HETSC